MMLPLRPRVSALILFAGLAVSGLLGLSQLRLPEVLPKSAPETDFSAIRALEHLRSVASMPHPTGTVAQDRVEAYIVGELEKMGIDPEIQEAATSRKFSRTLWCGTVRNILARIPGRAPGKTVLFASHYDSVPEGPGAGDDGSAVAATLEAIRALLQGAALKNDLLFLFTDGEEIGLLGAKAFVDQHPAAGDVGIVFNFEARGTGGPVIMFETSPGNERLLEEFQRGAPMPVAYSYAYDVYRTLPNDTDFTVFKEADISGLNFAFIHGSAGYHSVGDQIDQLELETLQHQGSLVLALARHFGDVDLDSLESDRNAIYFNTFGSTLLLYSGSWQLALSLGAGVLSMVVIFFGWRTGRFGILGLLGGAAGLFLGVLVTVLVMTLIRWLLLRPVPLPEAQAMGGTQVYLLGGVLIACGLMSLLLDVAHRRGVRLATLAAGALLAWTVAAVLTSLYLPASSYLFAWPALLGAAALGGWLYAGREPLSPGLVVLLVVCAAPAMILWTPAISLIATALTFEAMHIVAGLVAWLLGAVILQLGVIVTGWRRPFAIALLLLGIGVIGVGVAASGFDAAHLRPNSVIYGLDLQSKEAFWASFDDQPDEWTSQFFPPGTTEGSLAEFFDTSSLEALKSPAPVVELAGFSQMTLIAEEETEAGRLVHLRVVAPPRTSLVLVSLRSEAGVEAVTVAGRRTENPPRSETQSEKRQAGEQIYLRYYAIPDEGFEIKVELPGPEPLAVTLFDWSYGLPALSPLGLEPRPKDMMPSPYRLTDITLARSFQTF